MTLNAHERASGAMPLNVLVVEDNQIDADVAEKYILAAFSHATVTCAPALVDARAQLESNDFDFVMLDLNLPDSKGLDTFAVMLGLAKHTPIVIYTSIEDSNLALQAIERGAQDYLLKGRGDESTFKRIIQYSLLRKKYEKKLGQQEAMLGTFVKHCPAGILLLDKQMNVLMASDRWCDDFNEDDAVRSYFPELFPNSTDLWVARCAECLAGGVLSAEQDTYLNAKGVEKFVRWEMMPWHNEHGDIGGVIVFMEMVTERYYLLKALRDGKTNLEQKVAERTSELEFTMLELNKAQAAKAKFFANMTHELRTPLHAILNFSSIGARKVGDADNTRIKEYFNDINTSGSRLLGLVDDLLDLTKHQTGMGDMRISPNNLMTVLHAVEKEIASLLDVKSLTIISDVNVDVSHVPCDSDRIHQVLLNLFANAIRFSEVGSYLRFAVDVQSNMPEPDMLLVSVQDCGIGIPEDELESVFNEFTQSQKVKSGTFSGGTGLGLAICRKIVEGHGGTIWAKNNDEKGVGIYFTLPLTQGSMGA